MGQLYQIIIIIVHAYVIILIVFIVPLLLIEKAKNILKIILAVWLVLFLVINIYNILYILREVHEKKKIIFSSYHIDRRLLLFSELFVK